MLKLDAYTFNQTSLNKGCLTADDNCFLGQERRADDGINVTRDHNNVRSELQNTKKKLCRALQNKRSRMLPSCVVLLHDNVQLLKRFTLQHFWSISTVSCLTVLLIVLFSHQLPPAHLLEELVGIMILQ
jgi:hypothetical protein